MKLNETSIAYLVVLKLGRKAFGHSVDQSTEGESSIAEEKDKEGVIRLSVHDGALTLQKETMNNDWL